MKVPYYHVVARIGNASDWCIVLYSIVLYLYIYIALLHTNQKRESEASSARDPERRALVAV